MNDLNPSMQARLEKWQKNKMPVKSAEKVRVQSPSNYRPVRGDYGDDTRDYEAKDQAAWASELANNPIYNMYR